MHFLRRSAAVTARADAAHCERIVREHARTFTLASYFLPPPKRRAAFALYAFCRVADDIVDAAADAGTAGSAGDAERALLAYEARLARCLAGRPGCAIFRELHRAVREFGLPGDVLFELVAGVGRDLRPVHYETWAELVHYCEGVASTVGEMCTHVFGTQGGPQAAPRALHHARLLGVAMQLTNILRDVGEDAAHRGRCYLPEEDLLTFGIARGEVLGPRRGALAGDPRWRSLMAYLVGRARALYEAAAPGVALLSPDAQRCAWACATGYAAILGAIERQGYDTLNRRARVGGLGRAGILWDVWRAAPRPAPDAPLSGTPSAQWYGLRPVELSVSKMVRSV